MKYYRVIYERCFSKIIKGRFTHNQVIDDVELNKMIDDMKKFHYEIFSDLKTIKYVYSDFSSFGVRKKVYELYLSKI